METYGNILLGVRDGMKRLMMEKSKGVTIRFLALLAIMILVIILIIAVFLKYFPELFQSLVDLVTNPPGG